LSQALQALSALTKDHQRYSQLLEGLITQVLHITANAIHSWLLEVFTMFKGFDNIKLHDFLKLPSTSLRGHILKNQNLQTTGALGC